MTQIKNPRLRIGGMATPLGVYMTTGNLRAGAGDLGLFLTGAMMTVFYVIVIYIINFILILFPSLSEINLELVIDVVILFLFLLLLRLSPLAGYHAAEHQTINAIENNLDLRLETVSRMQRFHPRCGSNLVALFICSEILIILLTPLFLLDFSLLLVAVCFCLFIVWKPAGKMIQIFFTTKKANNSQLLSGIKAGNELLNKYRTNSYYKVNFVTRIWNIGLLQVMAGWFITFFIFYGIDRLLFN